ncbi:MAG: DNA-processing protein DprA [Mogibacterium sp.]|nr:DNA-processing protein DprA [Mogibacterium sp.]
MKKHEIHVMEKEDPLYPEDFRRIADPPERFFYSGDLSLLQTRRAGVVGSRKYTLYGKVTAKMIGRVLADGGVTVVSGLAYGIDAFSHEGAREANGKAIAVLGMGIDNFSPQKNAELYEWVCRTGLVISEYEPDFPGAKYSFPARNRLISALSEKLILVEAGFQSGALITARYAAEQGKDIYAVPGNINSQFSTGTNLLIRDGCRPLIVIDDVLKDMGITAKSVETAIQKLDEDEIPIVEAVMKFNGASVNEISHEVNRKAESVSAILTVLEIKGVVYSYGGKFHLAN